MLRVLVIEDEDVIRRGLKTLLEEVIGGCKVVAEARDGREALNLLEQAEADLVISDIRMPGMDGLEAIRRIREADKTVPIVILTGHADFEYARRAIGCGVKAYLLKPLDRAELARVIETLSQAAGISDLSGAADALVRRLEEYAAENLGGDLSLRVVADRFRLNPQYLSRVFKERTGKGFSRFVSEQRAEKAKRLLLTTGLKTYEVAELCGFVNARHFVAAFKKAAGCTPSEVRRGEGRNK